LSAAGKHLAKLLVLRMCHCIGAACHFRPLYWCRVSALRHQTLHNFRRRTNALSIS